MYNLGLGAICRAKGDTSTTYNLDAVDLIHFMAIASFTCKTASAIRSPHPDPTLIPYAQSCTPASFTRTDIGRLQKTTEYSTLFEVLSRIDSQTKWGQSEMGSSLWCGDSLEVAKRHPMHASATNRHCLISTSTCSFRSMMCTRPIQADVLRPTGWHKSAMVTAAILNSFLLQTSRLRRH